MNTTLKRAVPHLVIFSWQNACVAGQGENDFEKFAKSERPCTNAPPFDGMRVPCWSDFVRYLKRVWPDLPEAGMSMTLMRAVPHLVILSWQNACMAWNGKDTKFAFRTLPEAGILLSNEYDLEAGSTSSGHIVLAKCLHGCTRGKW
jgi:hypothetical protein